MVHTHARIYTYTTYFEHLLDENEDVENSEILGDCVGGGLFSSLQSSLNNEAEPEEEVEGLLNSLLVVARVVSVLGNLNDEHVLKQKNRELF